MKLGMKYLLSKKEKNYVSVLPSLYFASGEKTNGGSDSSTYKHYYNAVGMEGQLLVTNQVSSYFSATLATRAQYNYIKKDLSGKQYGPHSTFNFGIRGNCRLTSGSFHFTPEFGYEVFPIVNGGILVNRIISMGIGVQL